MTGWGPEAMSNFSFLNDKFPVLANFSQLGEQYCYSDSNSCLMNFLEKSIVIKDISRKYIFRIALAYAFWSAVYTLFYKLHNNSASTKDIIRTFLLGH